MDPNAINKTFELPVSSIINTVEFPPKDSQAPTILFPQTQTGICGIAAFSSAFRFLYKKRSCRVNSHTHGYISKDTK